MWWTKRDIPASVEPAVATKRCARLKIYYVDGSSISWDLNKNTPQEEEELRNVFQEFRAWYSRDTGLDSTYILAYQEELIGVCRERVKAFTVEQTEVQPKEAVNESN